MRSGLWTFALVAFWVLGGGALVAQEGFNPIAPSEEELAKMLAAEPFGEATWPVWRQRYLDWNDNRTKRSREFTDQLGKFVAGQLSNGALPEYLNKDAVAWHLCARGTHDAAEDTAKVLDAVEGMSRRAIELDPSFANAHEGLAGYLIQRSIEEPARRDELLASAEASIAETLRLDPDARVSYLRGYASMSRENYADAEALFRQAMVDYPESESAAVSVAQAILGQQPHAPTWSEAIAPLLAQFPGDGDLMAMHALALARERHYSEAAEELRRAREVKPEIDRYIKAETVAHFEEMAKAMTPAYQRGLEFYDAGQFSDAEREFQSALDSQPDNVIYARALGEALMSQSQPHLQQLIGYSMDSLAGRFPDDGEIQTLHGLSLANRERFPEAQAAFDRAKALGYDPVNLVGEEGLEQIEKLAQPSLISRMLYGAAWFTGIYACIIVGMFIGGLVLSQFNREAPKVSLAVEGSKVAFSERESWSARLYMMVLVVGLILFYVAIPFVIVGAIGMTLGLLYGVLMLPRIPIKLLLIIVIAGFAICWGVLKSVFARRSSGAFGLRKTAADLPRLHAAVHEVAHKVGTEPTDEIYIAPGSEIGVHQEGRGPFGAFGVKRRVMTLGLSSLQLLTVSELKAILAHEYAHFSHSDTANSRFIHQVTISIEDALEFMGSQLGYWNYVNPFYWFFYLYYRAYNMLAAGFSRTREYLADRMAVAHYGKTAFTDGLTKVATFGQLFENTAHHNIRSLLVEGKAFENVYEALRTLNEKDFPEEERTKLQKRLDEERPSQFATHPTFRQRMAAIEEFPDQAPAENAPALSLVDDVEGLEKALTEYLTGFHSMILQAIAQQNAG